MLLLKHLYLQNFMSIEQLDMSFDEQTMIAITGKNGEGKSALIYATAFLLTGYKNGEKYENYVRTGTETAYLSLSATLNGEPLTCEAEIYKKKGASIQRKTVYKGVEYLNSDHDQFIKENELDYAEPLIFLFQDTGKDIIKAKPSERAGMLKKLFRFEFPEIVNKLKGLQEENKANQISLTSALNEVKSQTFETLPLLREPVLEDILAQEAQVEELTDCLLKIGNVNTDDLDHVQGKLKTAHETIDNLQKRNESYEREISNLETKINQRKEFLNNTSLRKLNSELESKKAELTQHKAEYAKARETIDGLNKQSSVFNYKKNELDKQITISETGVCHACGQAIGEEHVTRLKNERDEVLSKLEEVKQAITVLNFDSRDIKSDEISREIRKCESAISDYEHEQENLERDLKSLTSYKEMIPENDARIDQLRQEEQELIIKEEKAQGVLETIKQKEQLEAKLKELKDSISASREILSRNKERRRFNESIESEIRKRDQRIDSLNQQINDALKAITDTKTLLDIFETKFPSYLILQATQLLENCLNEVVKKAFPYMNIKLQVQRSGVSFFYTAESNQEEWLPITMASGAQKTILSLAYKISLARLHGMTCIFLDESDESCSIENSKLIYNFIGALDSFAQVIFISQRPEAIQAAREVNSDLTVYRVEKGVYNLEG